MCCDTQFARGSFFVLPQATPLMQLELEGAVPVSPEALSHFLFEGHDERDLPRTRSSNAPLTVRPPNLSFAGPRPKRADCAQLLLAIPSHYQSTYAVTPPLDHTRPARYARVNMSAHDTLDDDLQHPPPSAQRAAWPADVRRGGTTGRRPIARRQRDVHQPMAAETSSTLSTWSRLNSSVLPTDWAAGSLHPRNSAALSRPDSSLVCSLSLRNSLGC